MAKSPKKPASGNRRGRKRTAAAAEAQRTTAPGRKAASPRSPSKNRGRETTQQAESWAANVGSLVVSEVGRQILAEMLDAAARALRENRAVAREVQAAGEAIIDRGAETASTVVQVGAEVASGTVEAGTEVASAAATMARTAAEALATVATNAALNMFSVASGSEGRETKRRPRGAGKRRTSRREGR
jgi:hypothetical protein